MSQYSRWVLAVFIASAGFSLSARADMSDGFQMPSGKIACQIFEGILRCDVLDNLAPLPPRPKSCDLDWGHAFTMGQKTKSHLLCAGDTVMNRNLPVLAYGKSWKKQGFSCQSSPTGLTCRNTAKKGWFLNRLQQKLF